jgi:hypothetical protein
MRSRAFSARIVLPVAGAGLLLLGAAGPAAAAKPKPARLSVTSLSSPPATVKPGDRFTISGKVRNTGGGSSRALIAVGMRSGKKPTVAYALAGESIAKIRPGSTRSFKVRVLIPKDVRGADSGRPFVFEACARSSRTSAKVSCRTAKRRATLRVPAPPRPPAPPAAPAPPADPTVYTPGARTLNDTLFPTIGNGGYDAQHYDLDLKYGVVSMFLRGTVTMTAEATQNLSEFSLDLTEWNEVNRVTVDGQEASYVQDATTDKLVVTPPKGLRVGAEFRVAVTYSGVQQPYVDPDGSKEGWVPDPQRGAIVVSEPVGTMGWMPSNNVPFDKATFTTRIAVPSAFTVLGTGVLRSQDPGEDTTTYVWDDTDPTATYLYSLSVGPFDVNTTDLRTPASTTPSAGGLNTPVPFYTAVDSGFDDDVASTIDASLERTSSILDFYAGYYGVKYPFSAAGGIVPLQEVGYSLETQGKPTYAVTTDPADDSPSDIDTIAHENGHMWFGDGVTLTQWKDIWLNEGMTEFSTWLWSASANGGTSLAAQYARYYTNSTSSRYWNVAPAAPPSAAEIFNTSAMYNRGATTMLQVHDILGEATFRRMMNRWLTEHLYGNVTTEGFIALVKETDPARADRWTEFFRQWLYTSYTGSPAAGNKPSINKDNFDTFDLG